ncbi:MAG: patatin-like phospholipase family protein [candidate division WOR-3 bacterium]|nr:patatin-like phospholipase family protein [candidate division WOR-3 bacterium]
MKIGLALGGGSAKGLAHIGVLQVLREENIPINFISGTSIGAVVGAMYSLSPDASLLKVKAEEVLSSDTFKNIGISIFENRDYNLLKRITTFIKEKYTYGKALFRPFIVDGEKIEKLLEEILNEKRFEDTKIRFSVTAIDIATGKDVVINEGPLLPAVYASIAIPGLFPYLEKEGCILVDGGATQNVPVRVLKEMGADLIIASNLASPPEICSVFKTGLDVNFRVDEIVKYRLTKKELDEADVVISPNVKDIHWADYRKLDFCIQKGREAATCALPEIRRKMKRTIFYRLGKIFRR